MNELARLGPARATALEPQNLPEAMKFAELLADSGMVPRDYAGKPGACLVAIQMGRELNLPPLQAMQNISIINGRPSLWGDAALAVARSHPAFAGIAETIEGEGDARVAVCTIERRGERPVERRFSMADAKRAKLNTKSGPWTDYPDRMLQMRARSWALRDVFPDALKGLHIAEEAQDAPREAPREVQNTARQPRPGAPLEHAGRISANTIEPPPLPEPAEEPLPLRTLDGRLVEIRRGAKTGAAPLILWQRAAVRQAQDAPTAAALREWRALNGPDFGSIAAIGPEHAQAVRGVETAIDARLAILRASEAEAATAEAATAAEQAEESAP